MVVRWSHVEKGQSEYTVDCGWIDWSHATPGREDIKTIWGDMPVQSNQTEPDLRIRDKSTKKEYRYWKVRVPHLKGNSIDWTAIWYVEDIEWTLKKNLGITSGDKDFYRRAGEAFYKRAALTLYEISCRWVEAKQDDRWIDKVGQSGWSMEDLVSNLMAFYGHVEGLDKKTIITEANGWPKKGLEMSKKVYEELDDKDIDLDPFHPGFDQPFAEGKSFREAHLYNKKLSASITKDNRFGWQDVPDFFQSIRPLDSYGRFAGSDLLSAFDVAMLSSSHDVTYASAATQNYHMSQQLAQRSSTGRGIGKTPGPAGVDQMA